jgi:hypothetical protein
MKNIFTRLEKVGDLWEGLLNQEIDMEKALANLRSE